MTRKYALWSVLIFIAWSGITQDVSINYYLPNIEYDQQITTPEEFLGYQVGDWHVTHDRLYYYMKHLASQSDRIMLHEIGKTHEGRPLINLIITSPKNHMRLEDIKQKHKQLTFADQSDQVDISELPIVVYQGYSIHGNEASGSNASLMNAYYLAAGQSDHVQDLLDHTVIILDPSFNPDGLQRFSTWVNSHKSEMITADPQDREYRESWPRGRTNHYWFDLNRDWLLLTHPESQARIKVFHEWKPDVLTDHHEMGTNSTFFFQPGIPSRTNPNTPNKNQELTFEIGKFHAKALDRIGSLYYTKESFDDFYYGKGSTYPDVNGGIGILFEQASSRGHAQESAHGTLTLPFTVRNQVTTSLSTQDAALALREEILSYKKRFFKDAMSEARRSPVKGYVFGNDIDPYRTKRFIDILKSHQIRVHHLSRDLRVGNDNFASTDNFLVPSDQQQYKLIKSIFEKVTSFQDSLFYDVSAWTMPAAFDLNYAEVRSSLSNYLGKAVDELPKSSYKQIEGEPYAYLVDWTDFKAPKILDALLQKNMIVRTSRKTFTADILGSNTNFPIGTLVVPSENQPLAQKDLRKLMRQLSHTHQVNITEIGSGLTSGGFSLGSPSMSSLKKVDVAILVGEGVSSYDAGEAWHHFDQHLNIPVTLLDITRMSSHDLDRYESIVMVEGNYSTLVSEKEKLKEWVRKGGNLIACKNAIQWLDIQDIIKVEMVDKKSDEPKTQSPYGNKSNERGARVTGGNIVQMKVDLTHPLFYGYSDPLIATFKKRNLYIAPVGDQYSTPGRYTSSPLVSGYIHPSNLAKMPHSAAVFTYKNGKGRVIGILDNPNFRGYWWGTSKLFANAVYLGQIIE